VNLFILERYPPESIYFEVPWETERKIIKKIKSKSKDGHAFDWEDCGAWIRRRQIREGRET